MLAKLAHKLDQCVLTGARAKETAFLQEHGSDDAGDEALSEAQIARRVEEETSGGLKHPSAEHGRAQQMMT